MYTSQAYKNDVFLPKKKMKETEKKPEKKYL